MADPTKDDKTPKAMTLADAARLAGVKEKEALSFREYDDKVVVVTTAGQKVEGAKK